MTDPCTCRWSDDGEPLNVEAAIEDAIAWLGVFRRMRLIRLDIDSTEDLDGAIRNLARYGCERRRAPDTPQREEGE